MERCHRRKKIQSLPKDQKEIVTELKKMLKESVAAKEEVTKAPIRRMTRFQYANAVKDLLDLKVEVFPLPEKMMRDRSGYFKPHTRKMPGKMTVSSRPLGKSGLIEPRMDGVAPFPQDLRAEHGYDTQGDHLSLSPLLMEDFFGLVEVSCRARHSIPKMWALGKFILRNRTGTNIRGRNRESVKQIINSCFPSAG